MTAAERAKLVRIVEALSGELLPEPTGVEPKLCRLDGVRAVVFDVYGTLFVSGSGDIGVARERSSAAALSESLAESGFRGRLDEAGALGVELLSGVIGEHHAVVRAEAGTDFPEVNIVRVWKDVCNRLVERGLLAAPRDLELLTAELAVRYECRVNPVWPMPGAERVLNALRGRFRLGIVSNAQFFTPLLFESLLARSVGSLGFESELCMWSYQRGCSKPDPAMFGPLLKVLSADGIEPGDVVYVGNDMLNDVYTASALGCRTVLFAGDRRSLRWRFGDDRCRELEPDVVVTDLSQLPELLSV